MIAPGHLPLIFAMIAFWTGAGGWIVVMSGALNNISDEVIDSAKIDGANAWQLAIRVKLPLIKKWVVYMLILAFAAGTQLFVEPQLVGEASLGMVSVTWSPNQLAYYYATQNANFNYAAAVSVDLLLVGLMAAAHPRLPLEDVRDRIEAQRGYGPAERAVRDEAADKSPVFGCRGQVDPSTPPCDRADGSGRCWRGGS